MQSSIRGPKLVIAVREINQRSADETLLLRARYLQLVQALHRTREHYPATLAALNGILPISDLPESFLGKSPQAPAQSKRKSHWGRLAA